MLVSLFWASPASAAEVDPDKNAVAAFVRIDGELVEVDPTFSDNALDLTRTIAPQSGAISSRLIG